MVAPPNNPSERLDPSTERELHTLCTHIYDGVQTPAEMERFNLLLGGSKPARRFYLGYVRLHCNLMTHAGKGHSERVDALRRYVAAANRPATDEPTEPAHTTPPVGTAALDVGSRTRLGWRRVAWAVAASLAVVATANMLARRDASMTTAKSNPVDRQTATLPTKPKADLPAARLSYVSPSVRRPGDQRPFATSSTVAAGDLISLTQGELELTYTSGTRLLLAGPSEFAVAESGGRLLSGGLVASVTEEGYGFTIDTPNGKIIDRGTEFGVAVDDFGVSEVSVFQGAVEAYPKEQGKDVQRKIDLTKGRGLQWDKKSLMSLNANLLSLVSTVSRRVPGQPTRSDGQVVQDDFNQMRIDSPTWATIGTVQPTEAGIRLIGDDATEGMPPYLVTNRQFDPSRGEITVTCDFRMLGEGPFEGAVLAVLTRSQGDRGISLPPWRGTLAACTRCSFEASDDGGLLRAGVKMESSRELTSISQRGFLSPSAGTAYRAVVRDDGVNLSCTVSLRDDPSKSTTIGCRSLFRGGKNFIAFEGRADGVTLLERVEITQEPRDSPPMTYDSFVSLVRGTKAPPSDERRLLDSLKPSNATLVCEDNFNDGAFDEGQWQVLGEAEERDGVLLLGAPTADGTIDTWRPRPYLLTRHELDPKDGVVTALGRVRFSPNFLTGFGATFGVMTRSEARYGQGHEWEQSVLNRGVRATFWPAAWDQDRRFEIYERSASERMTLLATNDADVDPQQRFYVFQLIDDGRSVSLTVLDPRRPESPFSISASSGSIQGQGPVAFESCWGSPVLLDDISIYQAPRSHDGQSLPVSLD